MKKKITKLTKIFLLFVTFFSQISGAITVLADEINSKPLDISIERESNDTLKVTYTSKNKDYKENGEGHNKYEISFTDSYTFLNGDSTIENTNVFNKIKGSDLNNLNNIYKLDNEYYSFDGILSLTVLVKNGDEVLYNESIKYAINDNKKGLGISSFDLNANLSLINEEINDISKGTFTTDIPDSYQFKYYLNVGQLSDLASYVVTLPNGSSTEKLTAKGVESLLIEGTVVDLSNVLGGEYTNTDNVVVEEYKDEEVVNTYNYSYTSIINYEYDNEALLNDIYEEDNIAFEKDYVYSIAKGLGENDVITIRQLKEKLNDINLEVTDFDGNKLDLTDDEVLDTQIKNNYMLSFTKGDGVTVSYKVIVKGDITFDNLFEEDDLATVIDGYLNNDVIPSMDISQKDDDEFGLITFEDIMLTNNLLKGKDEDIQNESLMLSFDDINDVIYTNDKLEVNVLVNSQNVNDYINGIDAYIKLSDNLELEDIIFSNLFVGNYKDNHIVMAGNDINNDVLLTLVIGCVSEGKASIEFSGEMAKNLDIKQFETITKEFDVIRKISSNNDLESLNASIGTFDKEFDKDITSYTLVVPYDTNSVTLFGTLLDMYSSVSGLTQYELLENKTIANIVVTAEDGSIKTYIVTIIKEAAPVVSPIVYYYSSNNYLKLLEIKNYDIDFNKYTETYNITVDEKIDSLEITALAEHSGARVQITGNENFKIGENVVIIKVTAENGNSREYKIIVNKEEKKDAINVEENTSNTVEKIIIIVLIVLVVLGLLYLIFKKDEEETNQEVKKEDSKVKTNNKKNK